jgi:hypothetical protein
VFLSDMVADFAVVCVWFGLKLRCQFKLSCLLLSWAKFRSREGSLYISRGNG